ncbi:LysR family transcriptional regulator [Metaclostridioides mangenotii]|uniref:LysR family transcriptional regulator n=1 Tax=Metaclostridioides mangenotii TaxID=1540 RepID=UPI002418A574|nr:LysR family transcriptional regulator [Clostridioides mangenotii]
MKYLNTFKTILQTGSFINAARKLNYTQSTITFQIQQLENELSVKLFEKIGRKMVVTQSGKDILPYIDTILQSVEQLENYGKNISELTGSLKVAIPETLLTYKMQPVLKAFREQAPGVKLSVQTLNCYDIRDKVIDGSIDIGIHYDVGGYVPSMVIEKFADFSLVLIASPILDPQFCDFKTTGQRNKICLITNDPNSIFQGILNNYLEEKKIELESIMELGSIEAIKGCVASNLGVSFIPSYVAETELENGTLHEVEIDLLNKKISAVCTYHKNKWISPAMELFIRLTNEHLSDV